MNLPLEPLTVQDWPFDLLGIAYGQGRRLQLEVLYSDHDLIPNSGQLRSAWKARQARRGVPLLVIVLHSGKAHVCGPSGEDPTVYRNLDPGQVERICEEALQQPSRQTALRALRDSLGSLQEESLPGLRNEGFLATHELINGVPNRADWSKARDRDCRILDKTGKDLLEALGFSIEALDNVTDILRAGDRKNAVGVLLTEQETPESGSQRIPGNLSPVSYALARADEQNLDWVVVIHGRKIRLYPVKMDVGVGRKGRTETFLECHTGLLPDDQAAYLWLLFSADALLPDGSLASILTDSKDFAGDLASRLRERIYDEVVPRLAEGLAEARELKNPDAQDLTETYRMAMRLLFRLLFIAYGEDKDLLPYRFNGLYQKRSLKAKAKDLLELMDSDERFGDSDAWWQEVRAIFHAVDKGNKSWGVPAYNGGLFSSDPEESAIGAALEEVSLPDRVFGPALQYLLLVPTAEGIMGPVDFRSLGVREFGTIYEGLLESELSVAETDLTVETRGKNKDTYRPCKQGEVPFVSKGKIYVHNSSGARKSTGSYFTKHFAVEHLLDRALEPALDDHFARLDELDELEAAEAFFDFRVADIAMGSGHFLVAAVDRIEARFSRYLSNRANDRKPLSHVAQELDHLRKAARKSLGDAADSYADLEDNSLLRRLIARRCIYGVDINEVAVQLARLSIWIHTFVPGLPLSLLDRNLVQGNSLVGVAQLSELEDKVREEGEGFSLFEASAADFVGDASDALSKLGRLADATFAEIQQARKVWADAGAAITPAKALCDILTAARIEDATLPFDFTRWEEEKGQVVNGEDHSHALTVLEGMHTLHFPIAFPEVFLRERSGFDVILGNPPWEEVMLDIDEFWMRFRPGLYGMPHRERQEEIDNLTESRPDLQKKYEADAKTVATLRNALINGGYPGLGRGHPNLYQAFGWRSWVLLADGQRYGLVMPRSFCTSTGAAQVRAAILENGSITSLTYVINNRGWVFDGVHQQDRMVFVCAQRGRDPHTFSISGLYSDLETFNRDADKEPAMFTAAEVLGWSGTATWPMLPGTDSAEVFRKLRMAPRLDTSEGGWSIRAYQGLNATTDRNLFELSDEVPEGYWPVYKGESFNIREPDTGSYYAWADPSELVPVLFERRLRAARNRRSPFHSLQGTGQLESTKSLSCMNATIVFRDITNQSNARTVIAALIPPNTFTVNTAPYIMWPTGNEKDQAYLLGVLCSLCLDWYARRFVEKHLNFHILYSLPLPRPSRNSQLWKRVVALGGRLACPDNRFSQWAEAVSVKCGPLQNEAKQDMACELDAIVARLYGLDEDDLIHVFETFHEGWDFKARLDATLKHFKKWSDKS